MFCSTACEEAAWSRYHCLLCPGDRGLSGNPEALRDFYLHADATNDIFHLAAKAVATVALRAAALAEEGAGGKAGEEEARGEALFQARKVPRRRHLDWRRRCRPAAPLRVACSLWSLLNLIITLPLPPSPGLGPLLRLVPQALVGVDVPPGRPAAGGRTRVQARKSNH